MARIRSIKPEIRSSEKVNSWPIAQRYFWILLWGYCDDHGRGKDNARLIRADSFPLDDSVTVEDVEAWMADLAAEHVIERYALNGGKYFQVVNWREHQRPSHPSRSVVPCPHGVVVQGDCTMHDDFGQPSRDAPESLASDSGDTRPRAGSRERRSGSGEASDDAPPRGCPKHPDGTSQPCGPCGDARVTRQLWEKAQRTKPTPIAPRKDPTPYCDKHPDYPDTRTSPCEACKREVADQLGVAS